MRDSKVISTTQSHEAYISLRQVMTRYHTYIENNHMLLCGYKPSATVFSSVVHRWTLVGEK
jgi:hypothetical protein